VLELALVLFSCSFFKLWFLCIITSALGRKWRCKVFTCLFVFMRIVQKSYKMCSVCCRLADIRVTSILLSFSWLRPFFFFFFLLFLTLGTPLPREPKNWLSNTKVGTIVNPCCQRPADCHATKHHSSSYYLVSQMDHALVLLKFELKLHKLAEAKSKLCFDFRKMRTISLSWKTCSNDSIDRKQQIQETGKLLSRSAGLMLVVTEVSK